MRDWKAFSSTRPAFEEIGQPMILLSDDPPDHQRVRTVISKGMSAAVLRRWQEDFTAEAERLVLSLLDAPDGLIDGHTELAKRNVLKVFPDAILGLGDANREMLIKFGHAQFNMFGPKNDIYRASMEAAGEVFEWVATNCKRDAVAPGGVCMAMYEAADTGAVSEEEAEILVRTLYSAGSDTTIYSLGNTLRALAENPDQYPLLRSNIDEFATRAFEEGIRYDNPAGTRRRATTEVDVDGVTLPADAKLLLLHIQAGRDPRRWENPGSYDITRDVVGKHLGLGFGVHAWVGARVARLEGVSLLSALARHVASIELAGEPR